MKQIKMLLVLLLFPALAFAGVNLKNGNFYISYVDLLVPGAGEDLKIQRTYNSRATEVGWFGFGWGSDYETYLTVAADGSVIVHENGTGATTRFTPREAIDPSGAVDRIIEAMRQRSSVSDSVASSLRERLLSNAELRQAYARRFNVSANIADGTVLYANTRGLQEIHKVSSGFERRFHDGKVESFDQQGRLQRIRHKNGYTVDLERNSQHQVVAIKDSEAKQIFLSWHSNGRVQNVWSAGDVKAEYVYQGDNLVQSTDVGGNVYKYEYDSNHNMIAIHYEDDTSKRIHYARRTQFVSKIVERNGEATEYAYESNPDNPEMHYWTTVTRTSPDGSKTQNRYEYEVKARPDGSQYTYRILTNVNGIETETIYSECCSLPLRITRGNHVTTFEYNDDGLLTKKTSTSGEHVELEYHPEFKKITRVVNNQGWTQFEYDNRGNLSKAQNSNNQAVLLVYDRHGRITRMIDQNTQTNERRVLDFKYNTMGKPVEIAMQNVGKINVEYDNYGEIVSVESASGTQMAMKVTRAFQSLLSIVKPAGVNLSM